MSQPDPIRSIYSQRLESLMDQRYPVDYVCVYNLPKTMNFETKTRRNIISEFIYLISNKFIQFGVNTCMNYENI